jgi:hypothetical protein
MAHFYAHSLVGMVGRNQWRYSTGSGTKPAMQFIECRQNFEIEDNILQQGVTLIMRGADGPCLTEETRNQVYSIFHSTR